MITVSYAIERIDNGYLVARHPRATTQAGFTPFTKFCKTLPEVFSRIEKAEEEVNELLAKEKK